MKTPTIVIVAAWITVIGGTLSLAVAALQLMGGIRRS